MRNQEANEKVTFKLRPKDEEGPVLADHGVEVGIISEMLSRWRKLPMSGPEL